MLFARLVAVRRPLVIRPYRPRMPKPAAKENPEKKRVVPASQITRWLRRLITSPAPALEWVDRHAAAPHLEVQVRTGAVPGASYVANDLSTPYHLAGVNRDPGTVPVESLYPVPVQDDYTQPVSAVQGGRHHLAGGRGVDRRARRRGNV